MYVLGLGWHGSFLQWCYVFTSLLCFENIFPKYTIVMHHVLLFGVNISSLVALHCSGKTSMGLPDNIHWVGMFLLLSENYIILTVISQNFLAMGDSLLSMMLFFLFPPPTTTMSRSLAEFSRIPILVTNQVRSQSRDEACQYYFQGWMA